MYCSETKVEDPNVTLSEKKVQKLSLGLYLFKRETFVHFRH